MAIKHAHNQSILSANVRILTNRMVAIFMRTIRYAPIIELVVFIAICILTISLYLTTEFHEAILILTILPAYIFVLGGTNFITIKGGKISITYCYILIWTDIVEIKNVIKIESQQTFQDESNDPEVVYYEFRRKYQLEYRDEKAKTKRLQFNIVNNKKESQIVTEIRNALQQRL